MRPDKEYALSYSQFGMPLTTPHMGFLTLCVKEGQKGTNLFLALKKLADELFKKSSSFDYKTFAISCVDARLWSSWCKDEGRTPPKSMGEDVLSRVEKLLSMSPPFCKSGVDLFFHIKSKNPEGVLAFKKAIENRLSSFVDTSDFVEGNAKREGYVYGRRILHGLIGSVDPVNVSHRALIGDEDPGFKGGCYCLTQRFVHDWEIIGNMTELQIENMIGRDHKGNLVPDHDDRSHLKCVRVSDDRNLNYRIINQGQVFGDSDTGRNREQGVYVAAYAKSVKAYSETLGNMLGKRPGFIQDAHLTVSASNLGNLWYVPSAKDLALPCPHEDLTVSMNGFFKERSDNGYQYYNAKDFLHRFGVKPGTGNIPLSPRVMELLGNTFSRWHNNWYHHREYPDFGHLKDHPDAPQLWPRMSIPERKGLSIKLMLEMLTDPKKTYPGKAGMFRIDPREVLVGVLPPFTLGTGIKVMAYLTESEHLEGFFRSLDETSMAGHITPHYPTLLEKGIGGLIREAGEKAQKEKSNIPASEFYWSVILALEGVQSWFQNYAVLAKTELAGLAESQKQERENLAGIAVRMAKLSTHAPDSFIEAAQLVFGMHCCLHSIGELVSLGRFDQYMMPFLEKENLNREAAQEIIDAFCIKMDEQVLMNRQYFDDWRTFGTCAVPYAGTAAVPQGDKASQWVMQLTVGGWKANDSATPEDGCNEVTRLCLLAVQRLPVNSPCISLRMTPNTPEDIVDEAAAAILSGGAMPFFMSDVHLVPSLETFGAPVTLAHARDYCADGCWEPIIQGRTEFGLCYTPVMNALEATLNQGATYIQAGPTYLRGANVSFPSPPAETINSFDEFMDIFYEHYRWLAAQTMNGLVNNYGGLNAVCPSPLLSSIVTGCLESGRDLTHGGAQYHILSPMIFGAPCAIDSLWAVWKMVYDPESAVTGLTELKNALVCDWGYKMIEPLQDQIAGPERAALNAQRFKQLRDTALALPKFGSGNKAVDKFGGEVASALGEIFINTLENPAQAVSPAFKERLDALYERYKKPGENFIFKLIPAYGTFEDYYGLGLSTGASADGRRKGATLSSNFSPMPSPSDMPPNPAPREILSALEGWNGSTFATALNIPGPVDIDIPEKTPKETVKQVIRSFAEGSMGSNILSVNCCDKQTMEKALQHPEQYDLIRRRMGGWSEFFISMFPAHQQQHLRRPMFVSNEKTNLNDSGGK